MAVISDPILLAGKSFVTKIEGNTATVVRTGTGSKISGSEKETAGDYYNSSLDEIEYAKIYNLKFGANWISKLGASDQWMGTALTDPMYKDAFKKTTGKTGPNINFAAAADANLIKEPEERNTDANGSTTNKGDNSILYYPLNLDKKDYDYLKVTAIEYKPNAFGAKNDKGNYTGGLTDDADDRMKSDELMRGQVFLPMQSGLAESGGVDWGGGDSLNALDAAGARIAGSAVSGAADGAAKAAGAFLSAGKEEATKLLDSIGKDEVAGYFAGEAVGKNVFTRTTGKVLNPNLELLFGGPTLRAFSYNFRFTPREDAEAKMIRNIIRFFKKNMAPKREKSGAIFLKSPNVFRLKYMFKDGGQHPFLNKIKLCALTNYNVQYTPDGNYATYDDGSMTSYTLQLDFKELNPIFDTDYEGSDNDMGY